MQDEIAKDSSRKCLFLLVWGAGATVFFSSACLMMLELVAGRTVSRHFGSSLYTWTSVIGVTLAGMTIGNYTGGRLADFLPARKTIGWMLGVCSGVCVLAVALNNLVGEWTFLWRFGLTIRVLGHTATVLFLPAALIGAVIPVAVKNALQPNREGQTLGRMYALGAAGSILGTFLAGFWLIGTIGTANTLWLIAGAMLLGAVIYLPKSFLMWAYAGGVAFLITAGTTSAGWAERIGTAMALRQTKSPDILYEAESQYSYIAVLQMTKQPDERQFMLDNMKNHSRMIMGDFRDLRLFYTKVYCAATRMIARGKEKLNVLSIGGGGYVFPRYILDVWPGSRVDVAEIDPAVTKAATRAFGLPENTSIRTINLDGRNYVEELLERKRRGEQIPQYDFVYMDAFSNMSVPFQLVTRQFNDKVFDILAEDGVYIVNLIDMYESGLFLASYVETLKMTFPYVYVVTSKSPEYIPANFIMIAGKAPVTIENMYIEPILKGAPLKVFDDNDMSALEKKSDGTILDDDYVPVENFMAPVVHRVSAAEIASQYIAQAEILNARGEWEKAVSKYRLAIQTCPPWSSNSYKIIWRIQVDHGKLNDAADTLRSAIAQAEAKIITLDLSTIHYQLGILLKKLGDSAEASKHFARAIELLKEELAARINPTFTLWCLGQVEGVRGNIQEATSYYRQALELDPNKIENHSSVAEALAFQGQYEEAIQQLNESVKYMLGQGRTSDAEKLKEMLMQLEAEKSKKQN
jgi:spermidine synthase